MARSARRTVLNNEKKSLNELRNLLASKRLQCRKPWWYRFFKPYSFLIVDGKSGKHMVLKGESALADLQNLRQWIETI